jgi:hypothetical protein
MPFPGWVYYNHPTENGWFSSIGAPPERALSIQSYAVCMAHQESEIVIVGSSSIRPDGLDSVVAECPIHTVVSGGGFSTNDVGLNFLVSSPDDNGWRVTAINPLTSNASFRAYAVCVQERFATFREVTDVRSVDDGNVGPGVDQTCPAGSVLTGGGFASPDAYFEASYPLEGRDLRWHVEGRNRRFSGPAGPSVVVEGTAVCLTFPP